MPVDDPSDVAAEQRELKKMVERLLAGRGGGDSSHAGSGADSIALGNGATATTDSAVGVGFFATATGFNAVAVGDEAEGTGDYSVSVGSGADASGEGAVSLGVDSRAQGENAAALGAFAAADADQATAVGDGAWGRYARSTAVGQGAATTAADQIMLGRSGQTVVVPGTFSNPSARRLKQNITPAPELVTVFPENYEWEYIENPGHRRIGPMADDLVGTDGERFLVRDDDGEPAGIDKLGLHTAQIAVLLARLEAAEARIAALEEKLG